MELIGIVLALALLSWVLIMRGIFLVFLAKVSRRLIVNAALLYLFFPVLSLIWFFMAGDYDSQILVYPGFPFGLLAEIPLFFLAGRGSFLVPVLVAGSWILNFAACITIIYYVNKIIATVRRS